MGRLGHIFRKACAASPHEWQTRLRQAAFHASNTFWSGWGRSAFAADGHCRSLGLSRASLSRWLADRPVAWSDFTRLNADQLQQVGSEEPGRNRQVEYARLILDDRFPFFSHPAVKYSGVARWSTDPILNITSPTRCYTRIRYLDCQEVGDSKFTWEPNRSAWIYWLISADQLGTDRCYADDCFRLINEWLDQNPYPRGINYCSALEIALRNYAWLWGIHHFRDSLIRQPGLVDRWIHAVWLGAAHLERSLSYYFAPNTHLIGEAFGLFATGCLMPEFAEAERWCRTAREILSREAELQIHDDGTHRELSTCYHLYTTDFYLHTCWLAELTGADLPSAIPRAARRLAHRLAELAPHSGILPQLNDCDGGRLTGFSAGPLDARSSLAAAEWLWGDLPDNRPAAVAAGWGDHLWIRSTLARQPEKLQVDMPTDRPTAVSQSTRESRLAAQSRRYDSGLVPYRGPGGDYLLFRSGPFGYLDSGHSHDGQLGLVLHLGGQPVLVDSGTGAYTYGVERRNRFRCATGKNALLINGDGPSLPDGWFSWIRQTPSSLAECRFQGRRFSCVGHHDGFSACCGFAVRVERRVNVPEPGVGVICDRWQAESPVSASACWTLAPDLRWEEAARVWRRPNGQRIWLSAALYPVTPSSEADAVELEPQRRLVDYSPDYGSLSKTPQVLCQAPVLMSGVILTVFSRVGPIDARLIAADVGLTSVEGQTLRSHRTV